MLWRPQTSATRLTRHRFRDSIWLELFACLALGLAASTIYVVALRIGIAAIPLQAYLDSKHACTFKIDCFMTATQDTQDHPQASWSCIGGPVQIFARLRRHVCTALASRPKHPSGDGFHLVMALFPKPVAGAVAIGAERKPPSSIRSDGGRRRRGRRTTESR